MNFIWQNENIAPANWILTLVFIVLIYTLMFVLAFRVIKRKAGYWIVSISLFLTLFSFLLDLTYLFTLSISISISAIIICLIANLGDLRQFLANPFRVSNVKSHKVIVEKIYNRQELYKTIETAVLSLSKTRTGAIITFEKSTSLEDVIKNGVMVNAPVTAELLSTIFYPGTRLHDGAVVIRDANIVAASVFYTPTTKPFAGKYGSRHRAALGISEISDAVTIVVSEETGRISFAVNGELETVAQETFLRVFENYMEGINKE